MAEAVLALDLGTTGNRALIIDRTQRVLASAYREFPQIFPQSGWVEHDPEAIWETTRDCIAEVLRTVPATDLAGIGITNQRETVVMWDRATGIPIHPAIVWQCRRTTEICQRLKERGLEATFRDKTGLVLDPYFSGTKIKWLLENVPGARDRAVAGELAVGTIDTWMVHKLTQGHSHITDHSNASRTLLYNLSTGDWDPSLCTLMGVPPSLLARLVPSSGEVAVATDPVLGRPLPVLAMVGDQQAALFGQGCFDASALKNTYGTGLFLMMNTEGKPHTSRNLLTTVAWHLDGHLSYALEGSVFVGGAGIQWLRDQLGIIHHAEETDALARSVPDSGGVYFVPALAGLGAPYWDPNARGLLIGLTRGTHRGHIVRAALEAIAWQTRDVVEAIRQDVGAEVRRLQVDGGAAQNDFLMQFQADVLGIPVERPVNLQSTAMGAAGLAGLAAGLWQSPAEFASLRRVDRIFTPGLDPGQRERQYGLWRLAVERSLGWAAHTG